MKTHLDVSSGLRSETACGKSLHSYYARRPKNVTTDLKEVTCLLCLSRKV